MTDREVYKQQLKIDMSIRLMDLRKAKNWSQAYAAERADISQQALSDAEASKTMLMPDTLTKLAIAYSVSVDFLLTGQISTHDLQREHERAQKHGSKIFFHWQAMSDHFFDALDITEDIE